MEINSALELELSSYPKEKWWGDDYLYNIGGFWFLPETVHTVNRVISHFKPLPSDIILTSAPKTGTTLLKALIYSIVNRSSRHLLSKESPHDLIPTLEFQVYTTPNEPFAADPSSSSIITDPRIFSTHIPYQLLAKTLESSECRIVYVTRNPKDTMISAWHFVNKMEKAKKEPWAFSEAMEKLHLGISPYGPLHDHVMGYRNLSIERPQHVLFLTYEDLMENPKPHVKKLAEFLGRPFEGDDAKEQLEEVVKSCSFQVLSKHEVNKSEEYPSWIQMPYHAVFRKGAVGDYKNYLTPELIQRVDAVTRDKYHSAGFMYGI